MLSPVRVAPPAERPVSLEEAKAHLRLDHDDDDALVDALLQAATDHLDGWSGILGRALVTQEWRVDTRAFPCNGHLKLPLMPVQSVTVAYWDSDNTDQEFAGDSYSLHVNALGAVLVLGHGMSWPSVYSREDAVRVTFVAGYGDAADVPAPLKQAILLLVGHWYEQRAAAGPSMASIPLAFDALVAPYRRFSL